jgi:ribosomal protein S24E
VTPAERKVFDRHCRDEFGFTSQGLKYKIHDIVDRLTKVEGHCNEKGPVVGATIAKLEAMHSVLESKNIISSKEIHGAVKAILGANSDNIKMIEGKL